MTLRLSHFAAIAAVATLLVGLGGIMATWTVADREFREVLDDDLEQQATLLAESVARSTLRMNDESFARLLADVFVDDDEDTIWVSVYDRESGEVLSNLAHDLPLESTNDGPLRRELGGFGWQGMQAHVDGVVVQLLRRDDLYDDVREDMLEQIIAPALLGGIGILLLVAALITLIVRPLMRLAREVEARRPDSLEPLTTATPAHEIRVLRDSINGLIAGIEDVLQRERRFASDVAHELRTPMTTLKLELGSAEPDLATSRAEVDRLARLVEELLTLARVEQGRSRFERIALHGLCAGVIRGLDARFAARSMQLDSHLAPITVDGDATLLDILLRNLLRNVLDHCPDGTRAAVTLEVGDRRARLRVADDGPGIAEATREQMRGGLTRLDSRSGAGLGLAICQRIVAAHGGEIRFAAAAGGTGLVVVVDLPA
jgi:signal transduction histidine kinase